MSDVDEKRMAPNAEPRSSESTKDAPLLGQKSPGVERIEAIAAHITFWDRVALFFGVFLIAYAYGLDGTLRYSYQVCSLATGYGMRAHC
jgi:SIT family siderophore-iron:H+ symporter-like MFS transporter